MLVCSVRQSLVLSAAMRASPSLLAGAAPQAAANTSEKATAAKKLNSDEKVLLSLLIVCVSTGTWHGT